VSDTGWCFSNHHDAAIKGLRLGSPVARTYFSRRGADGTPYTSHLEPLEALLEDCTELKRVSKEATSFRSRCRELGAVADQIQYSARNAASKINSENSSILLSRILSSCHKEVFLAQTRIEVQLLVLPV
jgi:hypothetical protein